MTAARAPIRLEGGMAGGTVHLGFAVGTGEPVAVPVGHLAVTGQTQAAGKTTTLEALVSRSGLSAVAFVTKRHEGSFRSDHHRLPPYFRERADWQFVSAVLEATLREKMRFERSWIMRACKGAKTLADVQGNVRKLMDRAKGLSADVYMTLDHYLDIVVPQIGRLDTAVPLSLSPGLNVMDLSAYTAELQALVIRSVIEWVHDHGRNVLTIIPEAWEFIPQNRGSPVLLACEQLIRKGGAGFNFVWLDSQDIAGVHKNVLRQVGVWILGVQREAHEVKRTLAHIPGRKPSIDDVMQLERGQFFVCFGRTVVKTYVQPAWMHEERARLIALDRAPIPPAPEATGDKAVDEAEAERLREHNAQLVTRCRVLEGELADLRQRLDAVLTKPARAPHAPPYQPDPAGSKPHGDPPNADSAGRPPPHDRMPLMSAIYDYVKERLLTDAEADPKLLAVLRRVPEIEVAKQVERIRVSYDKQPGVLAAMIVEGFFAEPVKPATIKDELRRRGRPVHDANVSRDLGTLTEQGFLTREDGGTYQAVPGMKVNIVEA